MHQSKISAMTHCNTQQERGLPIDALGSGPWLVIAPHDDDTMLGAGGAIAAAVAAGIEVHVCTVTDGRMGWWQPEDAANLVTTRQEELRASLDVLGVPSERQHELQMPDGSLNQWQGCRPDSDGSGLGRLLVRLLRQIAPNTVFVCTDADLHPDHRIVSTETTMACCWAASQIWAELGTPIADPTIWHYAVYCAFPKDPDVQVQLSDEHFTTKLDSLKTFKSQAFIDDMMERLTADGPVEYFQQAAWTPYRPATYSNLFA